MLFRSTKMNFNSGGNADKKVWKDIKGCGQGLSSIKDSPAVSDLVAQMREEFLEATSSFKSKASSY